MLFQLQIENIGIIDKLDIEFDEKLNVFTGETGAGKSIIISALSMILGERVNAKEIIRKDKEIGRVTGLFRLEETNPAIKFLESSNLPSSEGEILIQREININGKSKTTINGAIATLQMVKDLGNLLVDIHGTYDHQKLLNSENHLMYLDKFSAVDKEINAYNSKFSLWKNKKAQLKEIEDNFKIKSEKMEYMKFQLKELEFLEKIADIEEEKLEREHSILSDYLRIKEISEEALSIGCKSNESLNLKLKEFSQCLSALNEFDKSFGENLNEINSLKISISDAIDKVKSFAHNLEPNPSRLEELDSILGKIRNQKLKYGLSYKELIDFYKKLKRDIKSIEDAPDTLTLQKEIEEIKTELISKAEALTKKRKIKSKDFKKNLETELGDLGMNTAQVFIDIKDTEFTESGKDRVEFMIITNPGENEKPLNKIVSGGELCRIMLAFKVIVSETDDIPVLVFDEIDANIGGVTALSAANKMKTVSEKRQIITITHQPQIAAKADKHFAVEKVIIDNRNNTKVKVLNMEDRVIEIARMLGGHDITSVVKKHAKEMLSL